MRLGILGCSLSVSFGPGVTPAQRVELRRSWSRCLEDDDAGTDEPSDAPRGRSSREGPPFTASAPFTANIAAPDGAVVPVAGVPVAGETFERFAAELTSVLTLTAIEARSGELLMLHASGLADPATGRTAALVGPSGVGKTTATRALAGLLGYVSDETVGIERSGSVVPYPKPLSVIVDGPPAPKRQLGPDELGLRVAPPEAQLGAVVLLDRVPREAPSAPVEVQPLGHAEAIVGLAPHTSALARLHRPLQWLCSALDACGGAVRVAYREAEDLGAVIPRLLTRPCVAGEWLPALGLGSADDAAPQPGLVRRAGVVDAVEVRVPGDSGRSELLVMARERVLRLGGIAPAVWRALGTPATLDALAARIAPEVGLPEGYEEALGRVVGELGDHGVLART